MQKSSKMFVVNSVSGFEGFGGTPLPKLPLSASTPPSLPPSGFANLSPAVASTCCSSLAGVSCGNPMDNPTCLRRTLLNSPRWLNTVTGDETGLTFHYWYQPLHHPPSSWKVVPHHWGLCPSLFTSHKKQNSERSVRQGLWFFVLIQED